MLTVPDVLVAAPGPVVTKDNIERAALYLALWSADADGTG
jgi:hypothetical protein